MDMLASELGDRVRAQVAALGTETSKMLIGGKLVDAQSGATFEVENPATGEVIAQVPRGEAADVDAAVKAARYSFDSGSWRRLPAAERAKLIWRLAEEIEAANDELAILETLDNGMPFAMAKNGAIPLAAESMRYFSGWPTKLAGETLPISAPGEWHAYTLRQPVGVVAAIVAWNFPFAMACSKLAAALAAGCSVVLKPAEQTPLSAARLAQIVQDVGFPPGVVNIVQGFGREAGQALVDHPGVDKISFTGSTTTGKAILAASARDLKRVTLELGGKSPNIIFADADLERAIPASAMGVFANSGQICVARSRLFVHEKVYEAVVAGVSAFVDRLNVGDGFAAETTLGPVVSQAQLDRVGRYVALARDDGAEVVAGGNRVGERGYFVQPTVIAGARPESAVMREEIFGPVVCAVPFGDEDIDAIAARANDTDYGLAASIWTRDLSTAHKLAERIHAGTVEVNGSASVQFALPFGGFKQSGLGRENGRAGVEAFTETKTVAIHL